MWGADSESRNMRAIGPDIGATGATDNRGAPRIPTEPNGTARNIKNVRSRTQIHLTFARFPYFRLLVFFSPLIHLPTPDVAKNGGPFETTDMLGDGRWRNGGGMATECATSNGGNPRNPTEPHGTSRSTTKGRLPLKYTFFPRFQHFRLLFTSTLTHHPATSVAINGRRFGAIGMLRVGRGGEGQRGETRRRRCGLRAQNCICGGVIAPF